MTGPIEQAIGEAIGAIERENPRINAFGTVYGDAALDAASTVDRSPAEGPLAGKPFAVKELYDVAGHPTRAGAAMRVDAPPAERDAAAVARLKDAGSILVGSLHMDEFAYGFTGENAHFGATRNPHDTDRIAGGSSSGSGAAVAAGLVPFALGSDTNGSVRVPAALCGVYGFKPTYGRVSRAGVSPLAWSFDHVGVLARDLRDCALVIDAVQGPDPRDPACAPEPRDVLAGALDPGVDGLRIARGGGHFATGALPEVFAAADHAAKALGAGETVDIADSDRAVAAALLITSAEAASIHLEDIRERGDRFDPHTRARWHAAALIPSVWVDTAQRFRRLYQKRMHALFETIDVLITPTTPFPATEIGASTIKIDGNEMPIRGTLGRFTAPFSFLGFPALSVPMQGNGALPVGVQLIAAPGKDAHLLSAAQTLKNKGVTLH